MQSIGANTKSNGEKTTRVSRVSTTKLGNSKTHGKLGQDTESTNSRKLNLRNLKRARKDYVQFVRNLK